MMIAGRGPAVSRAPTPRAYSAPSPQRFASAASANRYRATRVHRPTRSLAPQVQSYRRTFAISTPRTMVVQPSSIFHRVHIAPPSKYIAKTGLGIDNVVITKKTIQWPFQSVRYIDLTPALIQSNVKAMSEEKIDLLLPFNFTISPKDSLADLQKFAIRFSEIDNEKLKTLVTGIVEGQARQLIANMTIEDLFASRDKFKDQVRIAVQNELDQYGLSVDNINVAELDDTAGSNYFANRRKKILEVTANEARVAVAVARRSGDVGEKENETATRQRKAELEAATQVQENVRQLEADKSTAELKVLQAQYNQNVDMANAQAAAAVAQKKAELAIEVQKKLALEQQEKVRVTEAARAYVQLEIQTKKTETDKHIEIITADASKQSAILAAEAEAAKIRAIALAEADKLRSIAQAEADRIRLLAEAQLDQDLKTAQGQLAIADSLAQGLGKLVAAFDNNSSAALQALMIERGVLPKLADAQAKALQGLNPKVNIWHSDTDEATRAVANITKAVPPLLQTIKEQTGIDILPQFFQQGAAAVDKVVKDAKL